MCICLDKRSSASLESTSQSLLIKKCTFCCRIPHLLAFSTLLSSFTSGHLRLDVLLEFLHAEVAVLVELWQRLLHPQRCEAGLWALVPALLHDLDYGCQDLRRGNGRWENKCLYWVGSVTVWEGLEVYTLLWSKHPNKGSELQLFPFWNDFYLSREYLPGIKPFAGLCKCLSSRCLRICCVMCASFFLTGWEWSLLCRLGLCWSTHTTFLISSKLGSNCTTSKKGGRYSSTMPKEKKERRRKLHC